MAPPDPEAKKRTLVHRRGIFKGSITRVRNKFEAAEDPTLGQLETWIKSIQSAHKGFDDIQTQIETDFEEERDGESSERVQFLDAYEDLEATHKRDATRAAADCPS